MLAVLVQGSADRGVPRGDRPYPPSPPQAFSTLERLRAAGTPTFNDDIECTAAVTVAALLGALRLEGVVPLTQQRFLFFGAGQVSGARLALRGALFDPSMRVGLEGLAARQFCGRLLGALTTAWLQPRGGFGGQRGPHCAPPPTTTQTPPLRRW